MKKLLARVFRACVIALTCLLPLPVLSETAPIPISDLGARVTRQDKIVGAYELVHAPELGLLFVASSPSLAEGSPGVIHVLNERDLRPLRRIDLPDRAFALAMDHGTGRLYVGHTLAGAVSVVDARTGDLLDRIQLGMPDAEGRIEHVRMIEVDEARGRVFVTSPSRSGTVWIVDTRNDNAVRRLDEIGLWAAGLAHDPETGQVFVSGGGINEISVLNGAGGSRISSITTGDTTAPEAEASRHFFLNLTIDPAGQVFATDASSGRLYAFDTESGDTVAFADIGKGILDTIFNPHRNEVYVTWRGVGREDHEGTGGLAVLDAKSLEPRMRINLPVHPNSLEISPDGNLLFLTVKQPIDKKHPDYAAGTPDSVLRIELAGDHF